MGNPELLTTDLGPIIKKTAFNRIIGLIEDARKSDAKILLGGNALSPTTIEATVIDSPDIKSEIYQEEILVLSSTSSAMTVLIPSLQLLTRVNSLSKQVFIAKISVAR